MSVEVELVSSVVELGGVVEVKVARPSIADKVRGYRVELVCYHDCRRVNGSSHAIGHASGRLDVMSGDAVDSTVRLDVPTEAPISFTGALIRNLWRVEVIEDIAMGRDNTVRSIDVVIAPRNGGNTYTQPHPIR